MFGDSLKEEAPLCSEEAPHAGAGSGGSDGEAEAEGRHGKRRKHTRRDSPAVALNGVQLSSPC